MWLLLAHPGVANRPCADCRKYVYLDSGEPLRRPARTGLPVLRPPGTVPPCHRCPKVPPDAEEKTWEHATELSAQNRRAYLHYRECRAVGCFPDDPLVRRHAALIRQMEDGHARGEAAAPIEHLTGLLRNLVRG